MTTLNRSQLHYSDLFGTDEVYACLSGGSWGSQGVLLPGKHAVGIPGGGSGARCRADRRRVFIRGRVLRLRGRSCLKPRRENAPSQPASNAHSSISFDPQFPAFGVIMRPGRFDSMAQRAALSFGMRRVDQAGRSNWCGLHGEEAMMQRISGDAPIPAKWTEHVDITACPHACGVIKEVQYNRVVTLRADIAIPKNSINIDKFPKMFTDRTNGTFHSELTGCRNVLK